MTSTPRYVRFAQCLALVSGLSACGASSSSGSASTPTSTSTSTSTSTAVSSGSTTNSPTTLVARCDCTCGSATHEQPSCFDVGMSECCMPVVGPLSPPDLAV